MYVVQCAIALEQKIRHRIEERSNVRKVLERVKLRAQDRSKCPLRNGSLNAGDAELTLYWS